MQMGDKLYNSKNYKDAAFQYELSEKLNKFTFNYEHKFKYGKCLKFLNKFEEAIYQFEFAEKEKNENENYELYLNKSYCLYRVNKTSDALIEIEKSLKINPINILSLAMKGIYLKELNNLRKSQEIFEEVLTLNPKNKDFEDNHGQGLAYYNLGRLEEARISFEKNGDNYYESVINRGVILIESRNNYSGESNTINISLIEEREYKREAIELFDLVINKLNPDESLAYLNKGAILLESNNQSRKIEEALKILKKAESLDKNNPYIYFNIALAYKKLDKNNEALYFYNQSISINPNNSKFYNNKGNLLKNMGMKEEALECYEIAISKDKNYWLAFLNKGILMKEKGEVDLAIKFFNQAIKLCDNFNEDFNKNLNEIYKIYLNKIILLIDKKRYPEAQDTLNYLKKKENSDNENLEIYFYMGYVDVLLENYENGLENFETSLRYIDKCIEILDNKDSEENYSLNCFYFFTQLNLAKCNFNLKKMDEYLNKLTISKNFLDKNIIKGISEGNLFYITENLKYLIELEEISGKINKKIKQREVKNLSLYNNNIICNNNTRCDFNSKISWNKFEKKFKENLKIKKNLIKDINFNKNLKSYEKNEFNHLKYQILYHKFQNLYHKYLNESNNDCELKNEKFYSLRNELMEKYKKIENDFKQIEIYKKNNNTLNYFITFFKTICNFYLIANTINHQEIILNSKSKEIINSTYSTLITLIPCHEKLYRKLKTINDFLQRDNFSKKLNKFKNEFLNVDEFLNKINDIILTILKNPEKTKLINSVTKNVFNVFDEYKIIINSKIDKMMSNIEEKINFLDNSKNYFLDHQINIFAMYEANILIFRYEIFKNDSINNNSSIGDEFEKELMNNSIIKINSNSDNNEKETDSHDKDNCLIF
jgi:tetratricopeptide (TPR) repeat protein